MGVTTLVSWGVVGKGQICKMSGTKGFKGRLGKTNYRIKRGGGASAKTNYKKKHNRGWEGGHFPLGRGVLGIGLKGSSATNQCPHWGGEIGSQECKEKSHPEKQVETRGGG